MGTSDKDTDSIHIYLRELDRLSEGQPVKVFYRPVRGSAKPKERSGEITYVQHLGEDSIRFWFYDEKAQRQTEVTLRETLGDSQVRSKKTEKWSAIGDPVRVLSTENGESVSAIEQQYLLCKREGQFHDVVVAVASISWNSSIISWLKAIEALQKQADL